MFKDKPIVVHCILGKFTQDCILLQPKLRLKKIRQIKQSDFSVGLILLLYSVVEKFLQKDSTSVGLYYVHASTLQTAQLEINLFEQFVTTLFSYNI
jgi:hypothetical protein